MNVLFVCQGNTCRSATAEAIARSIGGGAFSSAGWAAREGAAASSDAIRVASANDLDLRAHGARPLTDELVTSADVVFALDSHALDHVRALGGADKAELLDVDDVPDPAIGAISYEEAFAKIDRAVRRRLTQ